MIRRILWMAVLVASAAGCGDSEKPAVKQPQAAACLPEDYDPDLVVRWEEGTGFIRNSRGQLVLGEEDGVVMLRDENEEMLYLDRCGNRADGVWVERNPDGTKNSQSEFKNGRRHGLHQQWDRVWGRKVSHYRNGKLHGTEYLYEPDEHYWRQREWNNGEAVGDEVSYFDGEPLNRRGL